MAYADATEERYRLMCDARLLEIAQDYDSLTATAQALLRVEFSHRSLEPPLIEEPDDSGSVGGRSLVTIAKYRDLPEAFVARSVLEDAGIVCFLQDENTVRADWLWSNVIGGARLQVATDDEAVAREMLSQPIPTTFPVEGGPEYQQPACPQCGSMNVVGDDSDRKIVAATFLLSPIALPSFTASPLLGAAAAAMQRKDVWKCTNCGCRWNDDDQSGGAASPLR